MIPTRTHYFWARGYPAKIWTYSVSLSVTATLMIFLGKPALDTAVFQDIAGWLLALFAASLTLGWFTALLVGWVVLGPLYHERALKNGAPFEVGARVHILTGPYQGRVACVYAAWQQGEVRVECGEEAKRKFQDVFSPVEILRVDDN